MVAILFSILISILYSRIDSYRVFQYSLVLLPLNYFIKGNPERSIHFIVLGITILAVVFDRNFGKCLDKKFLALWICLAAVLIFSSLFRGNTAQNWMDATWIYSCFIVWLILSPPNRALRIHPFSIIVWSSFIAASLSLLFKVHLFHSFIPNSEKFTVNEWGFSRLAGVMGDFELFSELLVLGIVCVVHWTEAFRSKIIYTFAISIMFVALLQTGTRSGLLVVPGVFFAVLSSKRRKSTLIYLSLFWFPIAYFLVGKFGISLIARLNNLQTQQSFSILINRQRVWGVYDSLRPKYGFLGYGPRFPWDQFQLYPHSLVKTLLFTGGQAALAIFILSMLYVLVLNLGAYLQTKSKELAATSLLLILFLVNELKVEFIRQSNYILLMSAFLAGIVAFANCEKLMATKNLSRKIDV